MIKKINEELLEACKEGNLSQVQSLLDREIDSTAVNNSLIKTSSKGNKNIIKLLLSHGADVNAKNKEGYTPLFYAAESGNKDVVEMLLSHGATVHEEYKIGKILWAVWDQYIAELLIKNGAEDNIWIASKRGDLNAVKKYIASGVDANAKEESTGYTALMYATDGGLNDIIKFLLKHGADVNARSKDGTTALMCALSESHPDLAELLIKLGADVNACTDHGRTVLIFAVDSPFIERDLKHLVKLMIEYGVDINAVHKGDGDWTALMFASLNRYTTVVEFLVENGANIHAKDYRGQTALVLASSLKSCGSVVKVLQKALFNDIKRSQKYCHRHCSNQKL